jgi:predicted nuclease of predicted toxin-antitoxin system
LRYYLDANLSPRIVRIVHDFHSALDITSAHQLGQSEWPDSRQLRFAADEGRILITEDRKDFETLALAWVEAGAEYPGILLLPDSIASDEFARIARAIVHFEREQTQGVPAFYFDFLRAADA